MGSAAVASWIGHLVFWILIVWGYLTESLSVRLAIAFALLWLVPFFVLDSLPSVAPFFTSYVAVLDIVLVFLLFRGDVRLT